MGQSSSTQSRSSRRQQQASASTRTRPLRPSSSATPRPAASSFPSPTSVTPTNSNSNSRSNSQTNNTSPGPPVAAAAAAAVVVAVLAHSSSLPPPPVTTSAHTSGTMTLTPTPTIPPQQGYSHSLLHQHQHQHQHAVRVNSSHHPNHIHSSHSTHSHHLLHHHQTHQQQQQQQRPLGTSSTLPASATSPVWHNNHHHPSSVPGPVATSTPSTVTSAAPASSSATAPSRVLRSTTRRRRLLSAFYPLLSRNSSSRGDATVPSSPGSAEPTTSHTQSQGQSLGQSNRLINNTNSNNNNSSTMTASTTPETRPPRHRPPERPLSRNGLQSTLSPSTSRSSRGRSRGQRRYDEQSIRSLRSTSSRSSSVLTSPPSASSAAYATGASAAASMSAAAPSMVPPSSIMSMHAPIYQLSATPQTEPMELDHGVLAPTPYSHHYHQQQHHPQQQHMSLDPQGVPAHFMPVDHATSSSRMTLARSRTDDSVFSGRSSATGAPAETSQGSRPEASHTSSSSRPDPSHVRFGGLFVGLSNPRGGTSISSSLLPIRPDSEDEDEYGHTAEDDRSQRRASSLYHHLDLASTATDADQQQHQQGAGPRASTGDSRRPRPPRTNRYPPPDIVADLIQGQIEQALAESAAAAHASITPTAAAPTAPSFSTSTVLPSSTEAALSWTQSTQQQQQQQQQHQQQRTIPSEHMATLPRHNSSSTSLETVNNSTAAGESHRDGSTSAGSSTSETPSDSVLGEDLFGRRSTRVHRRRLRSSSLRGLLGFQPMSSVMTEERLTGTSSIEGDSLPEQQSRGSHGSDGNMERPRLAEMRFFARLMSEIGRGLRGHSAQTSESGSDRMPTGSATATEPSLSSMGATHVGMADFPGSETTTTTTAPLATAMDAAPMPDATSTSMDESTTEPSPPVRPRRHTTIRFIQIGENGRVDIGSGRRSRSRSTGTGQGSLRSDSPEGSGREDHLADAIIMLLSNSSAAAGLEGESSDNALYDPDGSRPRHRRSPWLVLTLSGAFIGSLLAGSGAEGEDGGMSYDDLWALSNLIGPARPTTTTQEAIDNAGFHVGQFDDATKGMRGFHTLGDGSKCLVCMSDYEEGEDMRALTCKHGFHQECIDKWLTTGANKCPVCRAAAVVSSEPAMAGGPLGSEE